MTNRPDGPESRTENPPPKKVKKQKNNGTKLCPRSGIGFSMHGKKEILCEGRTEKNWTASTPERMLSLWTTAYKASELKVGIDASNSRSRDTDLEIQSRNPIMKIDHGIRSQNSTMESKYGIITDTETWRQKRRIQTRNGDRRDPENKSADDTE